MRNARNAAVGLVMVMAAVPSMAWDGEPVDQPRVVAVGQFDGGGMAVCYGVECGQVIADLGSRSDGLMLEQGLDAENGMSREAFCKALKSKRPSGCDADNPPSTPGLDASWQPNGCGTGGFSNFLLNSALEMGFGDYYSGDIDAPYMVSFRNACDNHDTCWGVGGNRWTCDSSFDTSMRLACGGLSDEHNRTICRGFAGAYFSAVSASNTANQNYAEAVSRRQCALWAHDIKSNGCD